MRIKGQYTKEQIDLLKGTTSLKILMQYPIFEGFPYSTLEGARKKFRTRKTSDHLEEEHRSYGVAYSGQRVKLYQFISVAEATPERAKQWRD